MLILALFLVLFSNHMEERLEDGKTVLRVDCRMTKVPVPQLREDEDKKLLIPRDKVTMCRLYIIIMYNVNCT